MSRVIPVSGIGNADAWFEDSKPAAVKQLSYNGLTYDVVQGNTQGTLLASAARTVSILSAQQTNYNAKGVLIYLNVTVASGTGGLTLYIRTYDPVSNQAINLMAYTTPILAIGKNGFVVYPGASSATSDIKAFSSVMLPRVWDVFVNPLDATSYTYSLGYSLIL